MKSFEHFNVNKFINRIYSTNKISNKKSEFILVHVTNEAVESQLSRFGVFSVSSELMIYKVSLDNLLKDKFVIERHLNRVFNLSMILL